MKFKLYDISAANIRVNVFFSKTCDDFIGVGVVQKVYFSKSGCLYPETVLIDGELCNTAGLTITQFEEVPKSSIYDRNTGVESIQNARIHGDMAELHFKGCAMFNITDGTITHNTTSDMRNRDMSWLFVATSTYPVYENNQFVGYYLNGVFKQPGRVES